MYKHGYLHLACLLALVSCPVWADFDYNDAPGYGTAWHSTPEWQQLGDGWDAESGPRMFDLFDDGVDWSVDGGANWGHFDLTIGQQVIFRFDMRRSPYGNHDYDQIKAWIDWNADLVWDNTPGNSEIILSEQWWKTNPDPGLATKYDDNFWLNSYAANGNMNVINPGAQLQKFFEVPMIVPDDAALGAIWLRARVHCWNIPFDTITPYGRASQGEVEDYQLTVAPTVVPVPTSSALVLSAIGLGMARRLFRRNKTA